MVHRREINGEAVVFGNHGALWGNAMTWWDHDTGSVWSQPLGEAILGPRSGESLELLPSSLATWADWQDNHPDTLALDAPTMTDRFDLETMAIVVEIGEASLAVPVTELRATPVVNVDVRGVPLAVVLQPGTDNWAVWSRTLDSAVVDLEWVDDALLAVGGDGRWEPVRGQSLTEVDENLDPLSGFTSFPDDYVTFFPGGGFWTSTGIIPAT